MVETVTEKQIYTYEDYLKTPDDKRYELIEGELLMTPSPFPEHQRISRKIESIIEKFISEKNLGEVFDAPCDVYLDDRNVVQPDLFFISKQRAKIVEEKHIKGAPDLVIEIISESSVYRDMIQKKKLYAKFGVKEYWIVIPKENLIEVYVLKEKKFNLFKTYSGNETLHSPSLKGFKMPLKAIF